MNGNIHRITEELKQMYIKKNTDYDNAFKKVWEEHGDLSLLIRLKDKMYRLENLIENERKVEDETIEDTIKDIAGYCVLRLAIAKEDS